MLLNWSKLCRKEHVIVNSNSGFWAFERGEDMSQTEETLTSGYCSSQESDTWDASTLNTDRRSESGPFNVAFTSAQSANSLTAIGRCRCGINFVATLTLDSSHIPALEGTMPHIETQTQVSTAIPSKRRLPDNVVDQIFDATKSQELALPDDDNRAILNQSNFVSSPCKTPRVLESQQLFDSTRQQRKQRFDQATNNNLESVQCRNKSYCNRSVNDQSPDVNVNMESMNPRILNGLDEVSLRHEQLKAGDSPFVNFEGNGVSDQPSIPSLESNTSSATPSCRKLLVIPHRKNDHVATYPWNRNLVHELYFETQKTNRRDNDNLHLINNMKNHDDSGNISSNDGTQTNHLLNVPVEAANHKSKKVIRVTSINTQSESVEQIIDATVPNNNPQQCSLSAHEHDRIENSTSSPQRLSCNDYSSRFFPSNTSATSPKTRKTKYLSRYLVNWEKEANLGLCWLTKGRQEWNAYCLVCKRDILIKHMGKSAVMLHVKGKQHSSRITQIETNLHLIKTGALQTHLNMSDYRIPAHENVTSDRTQNTELAISERERREQQEVTISDRGRATDNFGEWTARCNCGQTEEFFQEILNVSKAEEYIQMMSDEKHVKQIASQPNDVADNMHDDGVLNAYVGQSLDSHSITAPSNRNNISYDPSPSSEAHPHHITHQNASQDIDVEMVNPDVSSTEDVNFDSKNATHLNKFIQY